jgi:hypothetical protein
MARAIGCRNGRSGNVISNGSVTPRWPAASWASSRINTGRPAQGCGPVAEAEGADFLLVDRRQRQAEGDGIDIAGAGPPVGALDLDGDGGNAVIVGGPVIEPQRIALAGRGLRTEDDLGRQVGHDTHRPARDFLTVLQDAQPVAGQHAGLEPPVRQSMA